LLVVENMRSEVGLFLKFETLTLCYIDTSLIERSLLDDSEVLWLNSYHSLVYERLSVFLTSEERLWLKGKTKEI
jgi:Xaa-Pro aminopeptidase